MGYYLSLGGWAGVFAVPNSLIDTHIKLAGANELKIILWALRHSGEVFEKSTISQGTGVPEAIIDDGIDYWIQNGILRPDGNNLAPQAEKPTLPVPSVPMQAPVAPPETVVQKKMLRPDGIYIAKRMNECPEIEHLMRETESSLGKTISPSLAAVLINAHDDYELPCEVIMMIISYAKSISKTGTAYIEALTKNWSENGVFTLNDAERKLNELNEHNNAWKKLSAILGVPHRLPSKKEDDFAYRWLFSFGFGSEVIGEAYERCVNNTGKLQMSYMDKILEKWYKNGLTSLSEIMDFEEARKTVKTKSSPTYDIDDLEKLNVFDLFDGNNN